MKWTLAKQYLKHFQIDVRVDHGQDGVQDRDVDGGFLPDHPRRHLAPHKLRRHRHQQPRLPPVQRD